MDLFGKERWARIFESTGSSELENGDVLFQRRFVKGDCEGIDNEWTVLSGGKAKTFRLSLWLFSARELKDMLHRVAFANISMYGSLDGEKCDLSAKRLIAVARK